MSTKFCPVCKSAGKPESVYTSHFVKDKPGPGGVVVCPHLLKQKCGYCKCTGHTPKFCPKLVGKSRTETKPAKTKFCPVCKSAGKPESVYTSHFVKDKPGPDGVVVCPHLLQQKCGYCKCTGHTPKFCPKLAERNAQGGGAKGRRSSHTPYRSSHRSDTFPMSANQRRSVAAAQAATQISDTTFGGGPYTANEMRAAAEMDKMEKTYRHNEGPTWSQVAGRSCAEEPKPLTWGQLSESALSKVNRICSSCGCTEQDIWNCYNVENNAMLERGSLGYTLPDWIRSQVVEDWAPSGMKPKITLEHAKLHGSYANSEEQLHLRLFAQTAYTDEELESADKALEEEIEFDNHLDLMCIPVLKRSSLTPICDSSSWASDDE
uniref:Nanos-type domain-containing protein n=1 Tax=viral metagenome TaxID=1070528 RepID=A0A6C0BYU1_9ZZZZ